MNQSQNENYKDLTPLGCALDRIKILEKENEELKKKLQKAEETEKIRLQQIHEYCLSERKHLEMLDNAGLLGRQ